ncbi:hypothetical protein AGMMS49992_19620 [Clostridia bacterium]|nr:hypothetical protein AGMMS49992_19620 [Clostridia bacterium]
MGKFFSNRKGSGVAISWIASYLCVLLIPIIAHSLTLWVSDNAVREDIRNNNQALVEQMRSMLDTRLNEVLRFQNELRIDPAFVKLSQMKRPLSAQNHYDMWKASLYLQNRCINNYYISGGYIYLSLLDQTLCYGSLYDLSLTWKLVHADAVMSMENWKLTMAQNTNYTFVQIDQRNQIPQVAIISSILYNFNSKQVQATLVLLLDMDRLINSLQEMKYGSGSILLLDEHDNVLASSMNVDMDLRNKGISFKSQEDAYAIGIDGQETVTTYASSALNGWKYVLIAPLRPLEIRFRFLRIFSLVSIILSAGIGLALAYRLAKTRMHFIYEVMTKLSGSKNVSDNGNNEYVKINHMLDELLRDNDYLAVIADNQELQLQKHALARLLRPGIGVENTLSSTGVSFEYDNYIVAILFLNETLETSLPTVERDTILGQAAGILKAALKHINIYTLTYNSLAVLLLNIPDQPLPAADCELLTSTFASQQNSLRTEHIYLGASISASFTGADHIYEAYEDALRWVNYALMAPPGENAFYQTKAADISESMNVMTYLHTDLLCSTIATGQCDEAVALFNTMCRPFSNSPVGIGTVKLALYDICADIVRQLERDGISVHGCIKDTLSALEESINLRSMIDAVRDAVRSAAHEYQAQRKAAERTLLDDIYEDLKAHYTESDFNITALSRHLGKSLSYISKYYKDSTGVGLFDTLNRMRIDHAKTLIKDSNKSITSIINEAGFENLGSFIRVFKRYEGITPGWFQKQTDADKK